MFSDVSNHLHYDVMVSQTIPNLHPVTVFYSCNFGKNLGIICPMIQEILLSTTTHVPYMVWDRNYLKTCFKGPLKKNTKISFQDQLSFNAGQKYCRMLPLEHSAILLTFIKLPFVIKTFVLSIFKWPLQPGLTVH